MSSNLVSCKIGVFAMLSDLVQCFVYDTLRKGIAHIHRLREGMIPSLVSKNNLKWKYSGLPTCLTINDLSNCRVAVIQAVSIQKDE